jgi:hypothetical protein
MAHVTSPPRSRCREARHDEQQLAKRVRARLKPGAHNNAMHTSPQPEFESFTRRHLRAV